MPIVWNEYSEKSNGGTEKMGRRLETWMESHRPDLLESFDIYPSRVRNFDPNRLSVYWAHDLAQDPECAVLNRPDDFDLIVFVSDWQYQQFQAQYRFNGHNCVVINNGIDMTDDLKTTKFKGVGTASKPIRMIYHTTPHRGLEILIPAFEKVHAALAKSDIHVVLDVFSSFKIYGWDDRDELYQPVFDAAQAHPAITYHGSVDNSIVRKALQKSHIFAFPSIWQETSCLAMIEAMASKVAVVHPNFGALADTSGRLTFSYPFIPDRADHEEVFAHHLEMTARNITSERSQDVINLANQRARLLFDWQKLGPVWEKVLDSAK